MVCDEMSDKKLYMKETLSPNCWKTMTARERRELLKWEQAYEYSGFRKYPTTCESVFEPIPDDAINRYSARQLAEIAGWLHVAYQNGKKAGRHIAEQERLGGVYVK